MEQNEQELDLVKMVYSDLVSISDNGDILVKLPNDIEVVFSLPQGYPTKLDRYYRNYRILCDLDALPNTKSQFQRF
jgi:hypothetical protein